MGEKMSFKDWESIAEYMMACVDTEIYFMSLEWPKNEDLEVLAKHAWDLRIRTIPKLEDWMPGMGSLNEPNGNGTYYRELADIIRGSKKDGVSS